MIVSIPARACVSVNTGFQTSKPQRVVAGAPLVERGIVVLTQGNEDIVEECPGRAVEAHTGGDDPNHGVIAPVQSQGVSENLRIATEAPLPKRLSQESHGAGSTPILFAREHPSAHGLNAQNR